MRIALFNTIRAFGGGEKRVLQNARDYLARGHEVLVVCRPESQLLGRCREAGIATWALPLGGHLSLPSAWRLTRHLAAGRYDVVACYDHRAARVAALGDRLTAGVLGANRPIVIYYHGLEGTFPRGAYNQWCVAPRITRWVPNAEALGRELAGFGWVPEARIRVIYDGLDPSPILAADPTGVREALGVSPDAIVAVTVARLVPEKEHALLLRAAPAVLRAAPHFRFWIAGTGPHEAALRELAREQQVENQVQFLGFRTDVPRLLRAADILCHPSRKEGAPNAVREGMAAGLPVAAVAASGTPELVAEGQTGFLSPVGDSEHLARNLITLAADSALRRRLGEAGKERALRVFSEARCAESWLALFEECIRERRPGAA